MRNAERTQLTHTTQHDRRKLRTRTTNQAKYLREHPQRTHARTHKLKHARRHTRNHRHAHSRSHGAPVTVRSLVSIKLTPSGN